MSWGGTKNKTKTKTVQGGINYIQVSKVGRFGWIERKDQW